MTEPTPKKSDLGVRTLSAVVMVAVAGTALWLGGWVWTLFVAAVALGVLWEWRGLVVGFEPSPVKRGLWMSLGFGYVGLAAFILADLRSEGLGPSVLVLAAVIATDIGAYFVGRTIGGPKIAPKISPSKTWSGLLGGILGASLVSFPQLYRFWLCWFCDDNVWRGALKSAVLTGAMIAIAAQSGDFFESWMKRRAGVKDSGNLIPGHGGLFDRVDGLLSVCFCLGVLMLFVALTRNL